MLLDAIERAANDPSEEYHLAFELKRLFEDLEHRNGLDDAVLDALDSSGYSEFQDCLADLNAWYQGEEFDLAMDALDALDVLINYLEGEGLAQTVVVCRHRQIKIRTNLSGHDGSEELGSVLDTISPQRFEISANLVQPVVELLIENVNAVEEDLIQDYIDLLESIAENHRSEADFQQERRMVNLSIQLKQSAGKDCTPEQERLIDSFDAQAEFLDGRSTLSKASVLETALSRCVGFLSDEKQSEWLLESRRARKEGAENEMKRFELDEELQDTVATRMEDNVETIVNWYGSMRSRNSSLYALYCLLCSNGYLPDYERAVQADRTSVARRLFETQITSPEGHAIARNPGIQPGQEGTGESDRIPSDYTRQVVRSTQVLSSALHRLIEKNALTADDFYILINHARISDDRKQYLTRAVSHFFNENYRESFGLAIPQLEGALVDNLEQIGHPISRLTDDGTEQRSLGGLLLQVDEDIGQRLCKLIEIKYTDPRGLNQRNRWSHGQSRYLEVSYLHASTLLFDILLLLVRLDSTRFVGKYGLPRKTLETESDRRQGYDLSRYLNPGEEILGYAIGEDGTIVIPARNESESQISLIAVRGGVRSSFDYSEEETSREEICEHLEITRRAGHSDLPPANRMNWLDTDEAVVAQVRDILDDIDQDETTQQRIVAEVTQFGLRESRVKDALDELEAQNVIESDNNVVQINQSTGTDE